MGASGVNRQLRVPAIAIAISAGWVLPAQAKPVDDAAMQRELAGMRAQMAQMAQRIDALEGQLAQARADASAAQAKSDSTASVLAAVPRPTAPTATARPATEITWDGAPKFATKDGWSFKPRGRLQVDVGGVNAPDTIAAATRTSLGYAAEFRRAKLAFDGTMPGGFGYRFEIDLANSAVELDDVYLTYKAGPKLAFTLGQHKPFQSMEEATSDLFTSFMERAAFNSGFGFERRVGASATYTGKLVQVQAGVFTDNAADLNSDRNNSYGLDGRVVFMPKLGQAQMHIGGSIHYRDFNDIASTARYRVRPFVHTTDVRLIDTGAFSSSGERTIGAELAYISGRFHATAESHWLTALRPGLADPTFSGGYAELGYLLTDDVTAYKSGAYDRIRPRKPVGKGGLGAIQFNLRYDWLDLNSVGIVGGRQQTAGVSLLWMPTDYVRFVLNYGHLWIGDAAVPAGADRSYKADVLGMRAQFDF
jgi:phosphate-selective porin OprO and OprP